MKLNRLLFSIFSGVAALTLVAAPLASAADSDDFSLQVSPSPLVATLSPGIPTMLELKVRNGGRQTETLKIEPRSFTLKTGSTVTLNDITPPDIAQWVSFNQQAFTVRPGEWYTQKITIALPKEAGFSYSFALVISRKDEPKAISGGRLLKGSVAVFTLVNVDRPGATRRLATADFSTDKGIYEHLPTKVNITLENTGNSIVQPYGNVFIQRGKHDVKPLATLPVNETHGYILPGSTRTLTAEWNKGFPLTQTSTDETGKTSHKTLWNWHDVGNFRIGKYTAKLVAVYNDGQRDVPIEGEVTFWVIPWKILLGLLVVCLLALFGIWSIVRRIVRLAKRTRKKPSEIPPTSE